MIPSKRRPSHYARSSRLSYYSPKYGQDIKVFLSRLVTDPGTKVVISAAKMNKHVNTVYQIIHQGWLWLEDNDEKKDLWRQMRKEYSLCREGTRIAIRKKDNSGLTLLESGVVEEDEVVEEKDAGVSWRILLEQYVTDSPDPSPPLELKDLNLKDRDIDFISSYLGGLDDRIALIKLNKHTIKVVKNRVLALTIKAERGEA